VLGAWLLLLGRTVTAELSTQGAAGTGSSNAAFVQAQPPSIIDVGNGGVSTLTILSQTAVDTTGRGQVSSSQRADVSAQSAAGTGAAAASHVEIDISTTNLIGRGNNTLTLIDSVVALAVAAGSGALILAPRVVVDPQNLFGHGIIDAATCHALFAASTSAGKGRVDHGTITVGHSTTFAGQALIAASNIVISTTPYSVRGLGTLASIIDVVLDTMLVSGHGTSDSSLVTFRPPSTITGTGTIAASNVDAFIRATNASGTALINSSMLASVAPTSLVGIGVVRSSFNVDIVSQDVAAIGRALGLPLVFMPTTTSAGHGIIVVEMAPPPSTIIICQTLVTYPVDRGLMSVGINDVAVMQITLNDASTITVGLVPRQTLKTPAC